MTDNQQPRVSVLTPVYNGAQHLEECIQSVLDQTYGNFDYHIVNNCSTDNTLAIAERFAKQDSKIVIHNNTEFLSVVDNHNMAFSVAPEESKYVKIVGADDWLFPQCIAEMVRIAEQYPTIGMVTSYVLRGSQIAWAGLPYPSTFVSGREICRRRLLERLRVFGGPSASLLRNGVVRDRQPFYKLGNYHGDTEAYLDLLQENDFGFVHQILSYKRGGEDSGTTHYLSRVNSYAAAEVEELVRFGPKYLESDELERRLREATSNYYGALAKAVLERKGKEFWDYHNERMRIAGRPIKKRKVALFVVYKLLDMLLNPKRTFENVYRKFISRKTKSSKGSNGKSQTERGIRSQRGTG